MHDKEKATSDLTWKQYEENCRIAMQTAQVPKTHCHFAHELRSSLLTRNLILISVQHFF